MRFRTFRFDEITNNYDRVRIPLSSREREKRKGNYRYYGAQGVIDYVDDYLFDGTYLLIAEDGENLKSQKQAIAQLVSGQFWVNNHAHIVQTNELCDLRYLFYLINSMDLSGYITGSVQPKLSQANLNAVTVHLPDRSTQERIVSVLEALDKEIENNNAINENLYSLIDARYHLMVEEHASLPQTTVGALSERIYSGGTPSTSNPEFWGGALGWLSSGETRNRFIISTEKTITQSGVDNSSTKYAHKYDIVMASAGQGFTRGQTSLLLLDTYVNQSVIVVHGGRLITPYLFWNLANRYDELRSISDASSIRGSLTTKAIGAFPILQMPEEALKVFSDYAWSMIPLIEGNLLENERLSSLRDSLMIKLMSGELDVSALDL